MAKATATIERNADLVDEDGNYLASAELIFETPTGERLIQTDEGVAFWDAGGLPLNR